MAKTPELQRFYASKKWTELRHHIIVERGCTCEVCGEIYPDTSFLIAHHKIELDNNNFKDASISLNPDNIEVVCWNCHNRIHNSGRIFNNKKSVYLVTGSPLAGKTTYVRENVEPGDIVCDLDFLFFSVSFLPFYVHEEKVKSVVYTLRDTMLDTIRTRTGRWKTAWVIQSLPRRLEREALAGRLGAEIINVESTREDCIARVSERPVEVRGEILQAVNAYWDCYEA